MEIINQAVTQNNYKKIYEKIKQEDKIGMNVINEYIPQEEFFHAILLGEVFIAFWRKSPISQGSKLENIDDLLRLDFFQNNCRNLITKMCERPKTAFIDSENFSVGFVFDNPYRIPSKFKRENNFKTFNRA